MTLGELISFFYNFYLRKYGDPDRASVETANVINAMLNLRRKR